jgi:hypothetical protein
LDDVGTCGKDGMSAVVGYVAFSEDWRKFNSRWLLTLAQLQMKYLHTAKYLNEFPVVGGKLDDEVICLILAPFIEAVKHTLLEGGAIPICVITDCDAYEKLSEKEKKFVRPPEENSFEIALLHSRHSLKSDMLIEDAISVQMDESSNVPRLYQRYQWMKQQRDDLRENMGAICFLDDKRHPPVQAADMLGNILLKTWRIAESGVKLPQSLRELTFWNGKPRLQIVHFDAHNLRVLAKKRMDSGDKLVI